MLQRITEKLQQYMLSESFKFGPLTGLVKTTSTTGFLVETIWQVRDIFVEYIVDPKSGELTIDGFAEQEKGVWRGWFSTVCHGCCPGYTWWDKGVIDLQPGTRAGDVRVASKETDPKTCKATKVPTLVTFHLAPVVAMNFKELLPGKILYIGAAPAVGSQQSQFNVLATLQWDLSGMPVDHLEVVVSGPAGGSRFVESIKTLKGERDFRADRSGTYEFVLTAWNSSNKPLHIEVRTLDVPAIPGIGR